MARINLKTLTETVMLHDAFENASKAKVEDAIRHIFDTILQATVNNDEVAIPSIGKFSKFTSAATGKSKLKFSGAKATKDALNA